MSDLPVIPRVETEILVHFFDTDAAGVVHNIAYLRFIEIGRTQLAMALGYGLEKMVPPRPGQSALVPVVVRTEIDYIRPGRLGDRLKVISELESLERSRFFVAFEIKDEQGQIISKCRQVLAVLELPLGKPRPVPASWREAYPHLCADKKRE
jgi:acyl-CoA thioester hydrolase